MSPGRLALVLVGVGLACAGVGVAAPRIREAAIVVAVFFLLLAGGVLNWDKRSGH
jgi:hypothetical protein